MTGSASGVAPPRALDQRVERDPRINPQAGDVLQKKYQGRLFEARGYIEREVDEVYEATEGGTFVVYVGENVCAPEISIKAWRRWSKGAKVLWRGGVFGAQGRGLAPAGSKSEGVGVTLPEGGK